MNIILGVGGGIAAYKTPQLVRLLVKEDHQVLPVLTKNAHHFVAPMALQSVAGRPVLQEMFSPQLASAMDHIEYARWADLILVAPATANTMARLVNGMADDLLTTLCLATTAPLALAPAMNQQMWQHPATQENVARLKKRGVKMLGPDAGEQACGETGLGRMLEPNEIVDALTDITTC